MKLTTPTLFRHLGVFALASVTSAQAALLGYESFDYAAGTALNATADTNVGFSSHWQDSGNSRVAAAGLSYTDSSGNALVSAGLSGTTFNGTDQDSNSRINFSNVTSGSLYISFLFDKHGNGAGENVVVLGNAGFGNDQLIFGNSRNGSDAETARLSRFAGGGTAGSLTTYGQGIDSTTTSFVVFEFVHTGSDFSYSIYVNPVLGESLASTTNSARLIQTGTFGAANMEAFRFRADGWGQGFDLDEIRVGTELGDVTPFVAAPIPEPSTFAALAGLAVLGLAATRRRAVR